MRKSKLGDLDVSNDGLDDLGEMVFWTLEFIVAVLFVLVMYVSWASAEVFGLELTSSGKMVGKSVAELPDYHYCLTVRGNDRVSSFDVFTQCYNRYNLLLYSTVEHVQAGVSHVQNSYVSKLLDGSRVSDARDVEKGVVGVLVRDDALGSGRQINLAPNEIPVFENSDFNFKGPVHLAR